MPASKNIVVAFDLFGTLLSTESIAKKLAEHFGKEKAQELAATWRKYQLEYTWRLNSMNTYEDFSKVTERSLHHTLAESKLSLSDSDISELMKAYDSLSTFPDVEPALKAISSKDSISPYVFSNGTQIMVSNSVKKSPDLGPHSSVFKDLIVIEEVKRYKPAPEVYEMLARKTGKEGAHHEMWLVSGNPFDIVGARYFGMKAAWVDRAGNGWTDGMIEGKEGRPTVIVKSLEEVADLVSKHAQNLADVDKAV